MELKELIPAFAVKLGIEGLAAEDGACALEIDGIPLQLAEMPDGKALVATAVVGTPPPEKTEAFLELLLEANTETLGSQDRALGKLHDTGRRIGAAVAHPDPRSGVGRLLRGTRDVREPGRAVAAGAGELPSRRGRGRRPGR